MNVGAVNSNAPSPYEICGFIEHVTLNCQVGNPFSQNPSEVNHMKNFNPRLANDPYSSTYNPGRKKFSYGSNLNPLNKPPMNARPPLGFQRPHFPSQIPQKSNLEAMTENMLMAQQKQDEYIKQLALKVDVLTTHNSMLESQIAQKSSFSSTSLDRLPSKPKPNPREHYNLSP